MQALPSIFKTKRSVPRTLHFDYIYRTGPLRRSSHGDRIPGQQLVDAETREFFQKRKKNKGHLIFQNLEFKRE